MLRTQVLTAGVTALVATSVAAVALDAQTSPRPIRLGQAVTGQLVASDPAIDGRGQFHTYQLSATEGTRYIITMRSSDVDSYVWVARVVGGLSETLGSDDDSGGNRDARLSFRAPSTGSFVVVAQSLGESGFGSYELLVIEAPPAPPVVATPISIGQTLQGRISEDSPRLEDDGDVPFQRFLLSGRGERVRITMRSSAFDAYLTVLHVLDGRGSQVASDDDSGGGTDARVRLTVDGNYWIHARPLSSSSTGNFELTVEAQPEQVIVQRPITAGQAVSGDITADDPELERGPFFHEYTITVQAGERLEITLRSEDFDAFLTWGRGAGASFESLAEDDDGAGGTDSRIAVTVQDAGQYVIRVSPLSAGTTGRYTLRVDHGAR